VQLLNQEVESLADFTAGSKQAIDLVEMRIQARELLGNVDAQCQRRGLAERTFV
jgi:hypothetical protein